MGIYGLMTRKKLSPDIIDRMSETFGGLNNVYIIQEDDILLGAAKQGASSKRQITISKAPESGLKAIFCGEILNRFEIVDFLNTKNRKIPPDASDADIFCQLYREMGSSAVKKVSGFFCVAIWDSNNRRLHILLDRTGGIYSLYYSLVSDGFAFSTSIPNLLCFPGISNEIDRCSLFDFFTTGYVLPPDTFLNKVKKVRPGEQVTVKSDHELTCKIVDTISITPRDSGIEISRFKELLEGAVQRTATDEAKVSYLLSGGIDSSVIVALASRSSNDRLRTFTASFSGSELDESAYAQIVADSYNCESNIIDLNRNDLIEDLPQIVWHLDEPSLDDSVIPTFHLFREVRKHSCTTVSGDGPDHLFGRYYPLAAKRALGPLSHLSRLLYRLSSIPFFEQVFRVGRGDLFSTYCELFIIPQWGIKNASRMGEIFSPDFQQKEYRPQRYLDIKALKNKTFTDIFNALTFIDYYIDGSFGVFSKIGKMAKANDLLIREPYLDRDVVDYVLGLPAEKRMSGGLTASLRCKGKEKYLLKYELAPQILPDAIINKPKGGFTPPLTDWLRETVCRLPIDQILCPFVLKENYFNLGFLRRILDEHREGVRDWSTIIFMLVSFDLWVRVNIEDRIATPPEWKLSDIYEMRNTDD